ncbi:YwbE family protein [Marinomonas sp. 15G1-11]|uniref:YwbE family protein n=1 Tax=Marinomonas phaeophyticola TaxID=3004091 RepID=A0ABT4JX17_9GAMM|nr:YwbE family protein [Marinomonas sp. 15G1-11]MCZ2722775.1 YwbE family protein [Marinomonas sp. 15G1-11]
MSVPTRSQIKIGAKVNIIQKQDQGSGELTQGKVERLLTKSPNHPHGIKVRLDSGEVGRVQSFDES